MHDSVRERPGLFLLHREGALQHLYCHEYTGLVPVVILYVCVYIIKNSLAIQHLSLFAVCCAIIKVLVKECSRAVYFMLPSLVCCALKLLEVYICWWNERTRALENKQSMKSIYGLHVYIPSRRNDKNLIPCVHMDAYMV